MASDWAIVAVAAIGLAGSGLVAWAGRRTADKQAESAMAQLQLRVQAERKQQLEVDRFMRFAAFQMHKRAVYSDLLKAAQEMSQDPADHVLSEWSKERARAMVVAEEKLREHLMTLPSPSLPLPDPQLTVLVELMRADVNIGS
ncbi:hypothetical protein AB0O22_17485 [Streptomyces sp. NPDC091204]|uniref:hypothetical protein n=1 Tax=Streptomyces sp. NPDC091204 TaxID=3155299 RepID=UPI003447C44E